MNDKTEYKSTEYVQSGYGGGFPLPTECAQSAGIEHGQGVIVMNAQEFSRMQRELASLREVAEAASKWRGTMREHGSDSQEHRDTWRALRKTSAAYDYQFKGGDGY